MTLVKFNKHFLVFFPSALFLLFANYLNSVSLQISGITLTYVVKACIPVATVVYKLLEGHRFSIFVYISLVFTVLGVMLAAWSDMNFSWWGFSLAFLSMVFQTLLNVHSKKAMKKTGLTDGSQVQLIFAAINSVILLTHSFILAFSSTSDDISFLRQLSEPHHVFLVTVTAFVYHSECKFIFDCEFLITSTLDALSFLFSSLVQSLSFSVIDIARRKLLIIVVLQLP